MTIEVKNIYDIPPEMLSAICSNTNLVTLGLLCQVNRLFYDLIANSDRVWRTVLPKSLPLPSMNLYEFVRQNCLLNINKVDAEMVRFLSTLPTLTEGVIEFRFLDPTDSRIQIKYCCGPGASNRQKDKRSVVKACFILQKLAINPEEQYQNADRFAIRDRLRGSSQLEQFCHLTYSKIPPTFITSKLTSHKTLIEKFVQRQAGKYFYYLASRHFSVLILSIAYLYKYLLETPFCKGTFQCKDPTKWGPSGYMGLVITALIIKDLTKGSWE
jgi:hypothetical protein